MKFLDAYRQGMADQYDRMDQKRTEKALRKNPQAEWLYTKVSLKSDAQALLSRGWEFVNRDTGILVGGAFALTAIQHNTLLRKKNPHLA